MTCTVDKKEFLDNLLKLWKKNPDMRFGQLLGVYMFSSGYQGKYNIFGQEDSLSNAHLNDFLGGAIPNDAYWSRFKYETNTCEVCEENLDNEPVFIEARNKALSFGKYHPGCFRKKFIDVDSKY